MTFSRLIWFLNGFKVEYAWISVKTALRKKFGVNGGVECGFLDTPKTPKNRENAQKLMFLDTPNISLIYAIGPNFFLWAVFDLKSSIFNFKTI